MIKMASTSFGNWRDKNVIEVSDSDSDDIIETSQGNKSHSCIISSDEDSSSNESSVRHGNKTDLSIMTSEDEDENIGKTFSDAGKIVQSVNDKSSNSDSRNKSKNRIRLYHGDLLKCDSLNSDNLSRRSVKTSADDDCRKNVKQLGSGCIQIDLPKNKSSFHRKDQNDNVSYYNRDSELKIVNSLIRSKKESCRGRNVSPSVLSPNQKPSVNDQNKCLSPKPNYGCEENKIDIGSLSISDNGVQDDSYTGDVSSERNGDEEKKETVLTEKTTENKVPYKSSNFLLNCSKEKKENLLTEKKKLETEIVKVTQLIKNTKTTLNSVKLNLLPDKGLRLKINLEKVQKNLDLLNEKLSYVNSKLKDYPHVSVIENKPLDEMSTKFSSLPSADVQSMGVKARETHRVQQALTIDSLQNLHSSLNSCPSDDYVVPDPAGLKIPLMIHQKQALTWMTWREKEKPSGGILADDMGLGKTLSMISLILKSRISLLLSEDGESSEDELDDSTIKTNKYKGGTLVVCPSSLIGQWGSEIEHRVRQNLLSYEIHHGQKRERKARRLAKFDVIITSYSIARVEFQNSSKNTDQTTGPLFSVNWKRIILDEAHVIRNHKSQTAEAIFNLKAKHRWALTGTPVHNKMQDLFALIKFLRCPPFDDIGIWKKWVEVKDESGTKRLNMLTKSLMLRRTKDTLMSEGKLQSLPEKSSETVFVHLSRDELLLYEKVSKFSNTVFCQLLIQRAEKELGSSNSKNNPKEVKYNSKEGSPFCKNPALNKLYPGIDNLKTVKTHEILVLLLRLRQICCHPVLMKSMIEKETFMQDGIEDEDGSDLDLLEKMSSMNFNENDGTGHEENSRTETLERNIFNVNNPIYTPGWQSSKIQAILQLLDENLLKTDDKIVIVSQWSSMLDLLYDFLKKNKSCKCDCLTGKVPVDQRMKIVSQFNDRSSSLKVLLLSLTAGGTGLNLVGGNHLIVTDPHWNPQLEAQACDRVYRIGQCKPIKIYKFICTGTIEERILVLQKNKLALAHGVLSDSKQIHISKLSLNDLKMLFSIT